MPRRTRTRSKKKVEQPVPATPPAVLAEFSKPRPPLEGMGNQLDVIRCPLCQHPILARMTATGPAMVCFCSHPDEFFAGKQDFCSREGRKSRKARDSFVGGLLPSEEQLRETAETLLRKEAEEAVSRRAAAMKTATRKKIMGVR